MKDLIAALAATGIPFEQTPFPEDIFTAEGVAKSLKMSLGQVAKAMLVRVGDGSILLAVVPGDKRADLKLIKRYLNGKKVQLVDRAHVTALIGLQVGAVTPLIALANPNVQVVLDESLTTFSLINISSGDLKIGLNLSPSELATIVKAAIAQIST
jgi:Cys-tRNA(Pro) deacylase